MTTAKTPGVSLSHVAVLVPSVRVAADFLRRFDCEIGPEETFEGEGTKEIYVEQGKGNSLLLMEAIGPGAYERALRKRGPGLHHLAVDVLELEGFLASLPKDGWQLHEVSAATMTKTRTAWLYRRGFPALIEVQERETLASKAPFVKKVALPVSGKPVEELVRSVGLADVVELGAKKLSFLLEGGHRVAMVNLK